MDIVEQVERDRATLVEGLEQMQTQYVQMGQRLQQQSGALQYCDVLLERIRAQGVNGAAPIVEAAPVEGEID